MSLAKAWVTVAAGSLVLFVCALVSSVQGSDYLGAAFFVVALIGWAVYLAVVVRDTLAGSESEVGIEVDVDEAE